MEGLKVVKELKKRKGIRMECWEKRGNERQREEERAHGVNKGNVETREEEHGDDGGANTQERVMAVGEIAEPVIDDDTLDPLISRDQGSSENSRMKREAIGDRNRQSIEKVGVRGMAWIRGQLQREDTRGDERTREAREV
jgi:hypothetical protein